MGIALLHWKAGKRHLASQISKALGSILRSLPGVKWRVWVKGGGGGGQVSRGFIDEVRRTSLVDL